MKTVKRRRMKQERDKATVYTYIVEDDEGNEEDITSLQTFKDGDRVETWFDDEWNRPKMRAYKETRNMCSKCSKEIKHPVEHEFCEIGERL